MKVFVVRWLVFDKQVCRSSDGSYNTMDLSLKIDSSCPLSSVLSADLALALVCLHNVM